MYQTQNLFKAPTWDTAKRSSNEHPLKTSERCSSQFTYTSKFTLDKRREMPSLKNCSIELNKRKNSTPLTFLNKKRNSPIFSVPLFFNDIETKGKIEFTKEEENTNDNSYAESEATVSDTESDFINFVEHYNSCDYELDEDELNSTYRAKSDVSIKEFIECFDIKNSA